MKALETMKKNSITQLLVTKNSINFGLVHLQYLLKEGII